MTTYTPPPEPGRTASRRSRPVPLVIGILLALVGFSLLLGGLGLGWAMATQRDDDEFFSTPTEQLTTETVALSSEVVNFGGAGPNDWWADRDLATVWLSARSAGASAVFIGIAPSADVARYLGSASYDEISDLRTDPFDYSLTRRGTGGGLSAAPTDQGFWTAQSRGPGTQTLTWDLEPGTYTAVVMNVDGSPGVDVDLSAGGRLGWLTPLAWSLGLLGGALILGGALLVVYGALPPGPRVPHQAAPGQPSEAVRPDTPVTLVGAKDPQLNRGLWLVKWFLAIPHFIVLALLWLVFVVLTVVAFLRDPGHRPLPAWPLRPQRRHPAVDLASAVLCDGCDRYRPLPAVHPRPHRLPGRPRHRLPRAALARAGAGQVMAAGAAAPDRAGSARGHVAVR